MDVETGKYGWYKKIPRIDDLPSQVHADGACHNRPHRASQHPPRCVEEMPAQVRSLLLPIPTSKLEDNIAGRNSMAGSLRA